MDTISLSEMNLGGDIAARFWEPRKTWASDLQVRSFSREAKRLREQSAAAERGEIGGNHRAWRLAADMLETQAKFVGGAA